MYAAQNLTYTLQAIFKALPKIIADGFKLTIGTIEERGDLIRGDGVVVGSFYTQ